MRIVLQSVLVAIFAVATARGPSVEAQPLRWKFQADQVLDYEVVQETNITMLVGDKPVESKAKQTFDIRWRVAEVKADGSAVVQQTIQRVRLNTTTDLPLGNVAFDSAAEEDADQGAAAARIREAYGELIEKPFQTTVSAIGEVVLVAPPADPPTSPLINSETIQQLLASSSLVLPEAEVAAETPGPAITRSACRPLALRQSRTRTRCRDAMETSLKSR